MGTSYLKYEAVMKGSIHSDQTCPLCGSRFKSMEPRGMFCPNHPAQSPQKFIVRYSGITKRFDNYPAALQFLTGLRFQEGSGQFDARDYQIKSKPLSFDRLADEWLEVKAAQIKIASWRSIASGIRKAQEVWGGMNIKNIQYPQLEDFNASSTTFTMGAYQTRIRPIFTEESVDDADAE